MDRFSRVEHDAGVQYERSAIYYEQSDLLEYLREDRPTHIHRVDELLTLVYDLYDDSKLLGFRLKGFKSFYYNTVLTQASSSKPDFFNLVAVLEAAISATGDEVLDQVELAYEAAKGIAAQDNVQLSDLPIHGALN